MIIARANRIGLGRRENVLVADHQRRLRPGRNEATPEIQAFRPDRIADQLLLELARQIQLDAPWAAIRPRQRDMEPPGGGGQRPALQQQRDDDDDEGDIEIEIGFRQADQHRDRRQEDRDRAAQAGPGDEDFLPPVEPKRRQAEKHRERPRHQHQHQRHQHSRDNAHHQPLRRHQETEHDEHHDLRQPGRGVEKRHHRIMRAGRPVADDDAGQINREKSRGMPDLRRAENHQRRGGDKGRVQALRQRHAVERQHHQTAADDADDAAEHGFAAKLQRDMRRRALADRNELDQHQREKYRERIVGAGFRLQRRADARAQPQALRMHQQKHRRGIGGRHHRADQQRFGPVQVERIFGDGCGDQRRQQHADRRQHHRGRQHRADALKPRSQAAIEQDQRQRHRSHQIGGAHIVEPQVAGAGIAGQHADHQKHQQQRRAEAQRQQARQNAGHHQHRAEKNGYADRVERSHGPPLIPQMLHKSCTNPCNCILIVATVRRQPIFRCQRQCARFSGPNLHHGRSYR